MGFYVYPNNLMARRSNKKEAVKGGILLVCFILLIVGLYMASDTHRAKYAAYNLHCAEHNGEISCIFDS